MSRKSVMHWICKILDHAWAEWRDGGVWRIRSCRRCGWEQEQGPPTSIESFVKTIGITLAADTTSDSSTWFGLPMPGAISEPRPPVRTPQGGKGE